MELLRIGGVPEHFNRPWQRLLEADTLVQHGIDLRWRDFPDGSGAMAAALDRGELDAALLLTEGAVAGIARGGAFAVASVYTASPLIWGIHVAAQSRFHSVGDIEGATYAISRFGSGSHLMCYVHAKEAGWQTRDLRFATVGGVAGAIDAFAAGSADVFFWEKYMTQPIVDSGRFRRIGEFRAPWPAFVLCVAHASLPAKRAALSLALGHALEEAQRLAHDPSAAEEIAGRYELTPAAVREWLHTTRWAERPGVGVDDVERVTNVLRELVLIPQDFPSRKLVATLEP